MDVMRVLDEIHLREPTYGQRRLKIVLERDHNITIGRERLRRLMGLADVHACHPKPRTSEPAKGHKKYPYLMRKAKITAPNQAWCTDITYIPMARGFCYLCAIMDWHSRKVLGWALSTTIDTNLCLEAYRHAVASEGCTPEIMNTDQGRQFTSKLWTDELEDDGVKISMDGKGRLVEPLPRPITLNTSQNLRPRGTPSGSRPRPARLRRAMGGPFSPDRAGATEKQKEALSPDRAYENLPTEVTSRT